MRRERQRREAIEDKREAREKTCGQQTPNVGHKGVRFRAPSAATSDETDIKPCLFLQPFLQREHICL
jgi:hypothetical protein